MYNQKRCLARSTIARAFVSIKCTWHQSYIEVLYQSGIGVGGWVQLLLGRFTVVTAIHCMAGRQIYMVPKIRQVGLAWPDLVSSQPAGYNVAGTCANPDRRQLQ